ADYAIRPEFKPQPQDVVITKQRASVFFGTPLVAHLTQLGVQTLIICGESTSGCVRATAVDAYWVSCRAGRGMLLRPQHSLAQGQSVRHASQIRRRDACRGGDRPSRRPRGQKGELSWTAQSADCQRRTMKPAPYGPFSYSPIIRRPRLTWA